MHFLSAIFSRTPFHAYFLSRLRKKKITCFIAAATPEKENKKETPPPIYTSRKKSHRNNYYKLDDGIDRAMITKKTRREEKKGVKIDLYLMSHNFRKNEGVNKKIG